MPADILGRRRFYLASQPAGPREKCQLDAMLEKLIDCLSKPDIAENQHCVDLMALNIQQNLIILWYNEAILCLSWE